MSWKKIIKRTMFADDNAGGAKCPKCGKEVPYGDESYIIETTGECFDCGDKSRKEWEARQ